MGAAGHEGDTSLGGAARPFPETAGDLVCRLRCSPGPALREALEILCRRYWKPIYAYLRTGLARSNDDAKDLTQAFFLELLEGTALQGFDPAKGSFRSYLKTLLRRFVGHHDRALKRLKRGGGTHIASLDREGPALEEMLADPRATDPERVFDRTFLFELTNRAAGRARERCRAAGRETAFRAYEAYDLSPAEERPTYAELAARLGLTRHQLNAYLRAVREDVRTEIRREIAELTPSDRALEEEWNALLRA